MGNQKLIGPHWLP